MKFIELSENDPLEVIEVYNHVTYPAFVELSAAGKKISKPDIVSEYKRIQMRIFTDGEIAKESEETSKNIDEYYIGEIKYQYDVDTMKTKKVYFKNHSYVITYLIANELMTVGKVRGWFPVVKDVSIYLQNPKDKKALKNARQVITEIKNNNKKVDYSSLFSMLFSRGKGLEKIEPKKISENIYSLKRKNK